MCNFALSCAWEINCTTCLVLSAFFSSFTLCGRYVGDDDRQHGLPLYSAAHRCGMAIVPLGVVGAHHYLYRKVTKDLPAFI